AVPAAPAELDVLGVSGEGRDGTPREGVRLDSIDRGSDVGPALEGPATQDSQRDVLDMKRVDGSLLSVDEVVDVPALTGGVPLANGGTTLSTDHLSRFDPREVMLLMNSLQDMQEASGTLSRPWTQTDMANYLQGSLVDQGVSPREAQAMVRGLFR
ncbi:hypothetical protein K2X89_09260, partial [Myxococcota bacterium]|nr:hypothetical protein [Myxococcota bacterium]